MIEIMIVDDDKAVVSMLQRIITQNGLGEVVALAYDGLEAERLLLENRPQVALVDLLLPGQDGITLVSRMAERCPKTRFIMLSQVNDKTMVGEAYRQGVDFFIQKPINAIEVVSVVRKVGELTQLKNAFEAIETTARILAGDGRGAVRTTPEGQYCQNLRHILTELGICGELGGKDLLTACQLVRERPDCRRVLEELHLMDLLKLLQGRYTEETGAAADIKTLEMRTRRSVAKALRNLAALGIEDYGHERFTRYSTLFDYSDIKAEMDLLRGKGTVGGKASLKGFIRRLVLMAESTLGED